MSWFQWGQKAANHNQTAIPPKDATPRQANDYQQGHRQQTQTNKK